MPTEESPQPEPQEAHESRSPDEILTEEEFLSLPLTDEFLEASTNIFDEVKVGSDTSTARTARREALTAIGYQLDETPSVQDERNEIMLAAKIFKRYLHPLRKYQGIIRHVRQVNEKDGSIPLSDIPYWMSIVNQRLAEGLRDDIGMDDPIPDYVPDREGLIRQRDIWRNLGDAGADRWGSMRPERLRHVFAKIADTAARRDWTRSPIPDEVALPSDQEPKLDRLAILAQDLQLETTLPESFIFELREADTRGAPETGQRYVIACRDHETAVKVRNHYQEEGMNNVHVIEADAGAIPIQSEALALIIDPHIGSFVTEGRMLKEEDPDELDLFLHRWKNPLFSLVGPGQHAEMYHQYEQRLADEIRTLQPGQDIILSLRLDNTPANLPQDYWPMDVLKGEIVMKYSQMTDLFDRLGLEIVEVSHGMGIDNPLLRIENVKKARSLMAQIKAAAKKDERKEDTEGETVESESEEEDNYVVQENATEQTQEEDDTGRKFDPELVRRISDKFSSGPIKLIHEIIYRGLGERISRWRAKKYGPEEFERFITKSARARAGFKPDRAIFRLRIPEATTVSPQVPA